MITGTVSEMLMRGVEYNDGRWKRGFGLFFVAAGFLLCIYSEKFEEDSSNIVVPIDFIYLIHMSLMLT